MSTYKILVNLLNLLKLHEIYLFPLANYFEMFVLFSYNFHEIYLKFYEQFRFSIEV